MGTETESRRHWTLDPAMQPYFLWAGLLLAAVLTIGILANIFSWSDAGLPLALRIIIGGLVGAISAIAALFLWLSMVSYWWQVYRKEHGKSWFWLAMLLFANWVGAMFFYFLVF